MELNKLIVSPDNSGLSTSRGMTKKNSIEVDPNCFKILSQNAALTSFYTND